MGWPRVNRRRHRGGLETGIEPVKAFMTGRHIQTVTVFVFVWGKECVLHSVSVEVRGPPARSARWLPRMGFRSPALVVGAFVDQAIMLVPMYNPLTH